MKIFKTIAFGFIFLALVSYYYYYEVKHFEEISKKKEEEKKVFTGVTKDGIQKFTVHGPKGEAALQKEGDVWMLKSPVPAKGDQEAAKSFVEDLAGFKLESVIEKDPRNYKDFGLETPAIKIDFSTEKGEMSLWIGDENPANTLAYGKSGSEPRIFAFSTSMKKQLDRGPYDLRDKTILPLETDKVKRVSLSMNGTRLDVALSGARTWEATSPFKWRVDKEKLNGIIQSIKDSQIKMFVTEKPGGLEEFGLAAPAFTLSFLSGKDGEETAHTLLIGKKEEGQNRFYAKRDGAENVFQIEGSVVEKIPLKADDLRDKKLVHFDTEEIERIEALKGAKKIEFKKSGEEWKEHPSGKKVEGNAARRLLWDIMDLEFFKVASENGAELGRFGLEAPLMSLKLWKAKGEPACEISFGNKATEAEGVKAEGKEGEGDEKYYAVNETKSEVYEVKTGLVRELEKKLEERGVKQ